METVREGIDIVLRWISKYAEDVAPSRKSKQIVSANYKSIRK
jgi:hypothetical protein